MGGLLQSQKDLCSNPGSITSWLRDIGQVTYFFDLWMWCLRKETKTFVSEVVPEAENGAPAHRSISVAIGR